MPRLKPRKQLRKGKRRRWLESKQKAWRIDTLIKKHGGRCAYCGVEVNLIHEHPQQATIDHFVPSSKGGTDAIHNLRLACRSCNRSKGDTMPEDFT